MHKDGTPIWVAGESILIQKKEDSFIVKIIHNIHAQKQLERYLLSSHEVLDNLFESVQHTGLLLLDAQLRAVKRNGAFSKLFNLNQQVPNGSRLQEISDPFWQEDGIKADVRSALVQNVAINKEYIAADGGGEPSIRLHIVSKPILSDENAEKQLLLVIKKA
ncbi:MAG TPA: PAS domain-containing protein [Flavisolibacter sp.]|nr:PAS domain-containing protein [Flavisolibacter sp.]